LAAVEAAGLRVAEEVARSCFDRAEAQASCNVGRSVGSSSSSSSSSNSSNSGGLGSFDGGGGLGVSGGAGKRGGGLLAAVWGPSGAGPDGDDADLKILLVLLSKFACALSTRGPGVLIFVCVYVRVIIYSLPVGMCVCARVRL
jgi:hypothetical protein